VLRLQPVSRPIRGRDPIPATRSPIGTRPRPGALGAPTIQPGRRRSPPEELRDRVVATQEGCTLATASASTRKLRPLGDRVVIRPTAREEMTKSGIVLPDTAKEKPQEGTILAVGPGRVLDDGKREQIDVHDGDKVLYAKYAGTEFKVEGEELLIISQKDILAVVEE